MNKKIFTTHKTPARTQDCNPEHLLTGDPLQSRTVSYTAIPYTTDSYTAELHNSHAFHTNTACTIFYFFLQDGIYDTFRRRERGDVSIYTYLPNRCSEILKQTPANLYQHK